MRALRILQDKLRRHLEFMHAKQCAAFWRAVAGLLRGQRLWLTALGRSLPGACSDKHRIKAIDRLTGSSAIQSAHTALYAALAGVLLSGIRRPVLLVDWTGADPGFAVLSAKLCFRGRALTVYSRTFPKVRKSSHAAEREFLDALAKVIPAECRPILVTDAGFLFDWFEDVRRRGWHFVGRERGRSTIHIADHWMTLPEVHALAKRKPVDLGVVSVSKMHQHQYRVVLSGRPKLKGRQKIGRSGVPTHSTADRQRRAAAREPWVLLTSLVDPTSVVIDVYSMRMQIEETFRDIKSHRYGWSAEDIRSKDPRRIDVLLLIGAFAAVAMHIIGIAAADRGLQRGFQANTERRRTVFSTFFLGKLMIASGECHRLAASLLRAAFARLRSLLESVALAEAGVDST